MLTNVFICHNPFHVYISNQICKDKFMSGSFSNLIVTPTRNCTRLSNVNYVVNSNSLVGKLVKLWLIKRMIVKLAYIAGPDLHLFLPHIDGVIGNFAFKSSLLKRKQVKINFYYEGIVMLDGRRMERKFPRFIGQKMLISLFIFHRFIKYPDILPMNSNRIFRVYTPYPEKTEAPEEKTIRINFQREDLRESDDGVLIVGVDAGESLRESSKSLIDFIREQINTKKVFYKPHYADRERVFESIASKCNFEFKVINDTRCIEEIISGLNVNLVVCTHLSSALLNLKLIYKNELRVVFFAHPKTIAALGYENLEFASSLGIELRERV